MGSVRFTSRGGAVCALNGYPTIQLLDQHGRELPTRMGRYGRSQATGVLVRPGAAATAPFVWANWCGPQPGPVGLRVTLPGGRGCHHMVRVDAWLTGTPQAGSGTSRFAALYGQMRAAL